MITSKDNQLVKYIKSLSQKKYRDLNHEYIVEGYKMVKEALESNENISKIIICEELCVNVLETDSDFKKILERVSNNPEYVSKNVFEYISDTMSPQGILAIVKEKKMTKQSQTIKLKTIQM